MKEQMKYILVGCVAFSALLALSGCSAPAEAQGLDPAAMNIETDDGSAPVRVITLERSAFTEYGEYVGETRGIGEARLTAGAGGRVQKVSVREGAEVTSGQSLAEIDPQRARTRLETARLNERLAREAYEREQQFLTEGNSFQLRVDQAHLAWLDAQSALLDAERMKESAFAEAPFAGVVVRRYIDPFDVVEPGDPTFDIADLRTLRIDVGVPEADIAGVRSLEEAEVVFPAYPGKSFAARPVSFARARTDRTLTYNVELEVANPDGTILSGQTARVRLALRHHENVVVVPTAALYTRNNGHYAMVVRGDQVREIPVAVGASYGGNTLVSEGLDQGDRIVVEGFNRLADGAAVRVVY